MTKTTKNIAVVGALMVGFWGCRDQGSLPSAPISPRSSTISVDTLFTFPQDTVTIVLIEGAPPFSIVSVSSPGTLSCRTSDSTLTILASGIGAVEIVLSDASTPSKQIDVPVVVGTPVSFSNNVQPIFVGSYGCAGIIGGCHGGTSGLFLDNATVSYQNLVNVPSLSILSQGVKRVSPRDPAHSALYIRLSSDDPAMSMPQGRTVPFDPTLLANVRTWILQGAHFN